MLNTHRTDLFGAPDDYDDGKGRPGDIVFGDGEALAFPVLLRDGRRATVAVASTLWQLARHGIIPAITLLRIEDELAYEGPVSRSDLPVLPQRLTTARFGIDAPSLAPLLGSPSGPPPAIIVAASRAARLLWQAAVEERTLTALESDRTVQQGCLRTIELIPAGALFVSYVSNLSGKPADLGPASPIQLGAWEGTGLGYFSAAVLEAASSAEPSDTEPARADDDAPPPPHEVMRSAYLAIRDLRKRPEAARARSAIFDLGPRLAQRGLAVTLAFCLAKAGGGEDSPVSEERVRRERAAYRWILRQLFAMESETPHAALHERVVAAIREGTSALPPDFEETRLWLRRYAETMLPKEKTGE
jgi:hypothetical protein